MRDSLNILVHFSLATTAAELRVVWTADALPFS
ncbi:uncharacterized protein G2W53_044355 [Senna tora]|uniref:Uncharacterized protein n=1 Tax=Senna tora TaxID=362788 RepID=A0A834SXB0_9FABA|nr:uncharacterized protein G2W53_044355 [Senna tora]